jgi:hypothetical protein
VKVKRVIEDKPHMWRASALLDSSMPPMVEQTKRYQTKGVWVHQRGGELDWVEAVEDTKEAALEAVERWRK